MKKLMIIVMVVTAITLGAYSFKPQAKSCLMNNDGRHGAAPKEEDCPHGGGSCFFGDINVFGSKNDALYFLQKNSDNAIVEARLLSKSQLEIKYIASGDAYETRLKKNLATFDKNAYVVGPVDVPLPVEAAQQLGVKSITLKKGNYPMKYGNDKYLGQDARTVIEVVTQ